MATYIQREITPHITEASTYYPVITITGPRQSGKSTLCRNLYPDYRYVNLEDITTRAAAMNDPDGFLLSLGREAIIDEVQYVPQILSQIQVRVDNDKSLRYILTGSSNFSLLQNVSQSLAGRVALFTLLPLSISEIATATETSDTDTLMWRGFYPGVIADCIPPRMFYPNYYTTYVERDLRDLLKVGNILNFDKFIRLLALRSGSEFNASALAREVGMSTNTITQWMSLLATSYIAFLVQPYYANIGKRLTKSQKVYFYDTGLLCNLLSINEPSQLAGHPLRGGIFENLAVVELLKHRLNTGQRPEIYFYRENTGVEVDILTPEGTGLDLYEIKSGKTLQQDYNRNMKKLSELLPVNRMTVIYDGTSYPPSAINVRDIQ